MQRAKKAVSDSPGLVDFAIGLVNSVFNLPHGQWCFLRNSNNRRTVKSIPLVKKLLELVEMTSGLVNSSCKNEFLCTLSCILKKWTPRKALLYFFSLEKLALLSILKEVKPSPDRQMVKLLTFDNSFLPLRHSH